LFAETLKIRREELGYGQDDIARHVGVSQQTVSRWEQGHALPRPRRVLALAKLLDLDAPRLQRLAGYLPESETSELNHPWRTLYERMHELSRPELMLLMDRAWEELRSREGYSPPGTT
jgi:transcriptional regulator with XRE-family HTH domain